ncbi:hypothetical protein TGPRC2_220260 [Toxoplasma gondii TgCatPRC2]|uniref:RecQ-mediated genome instability protein 1 n=1 Tax=Toxoplasma gondii TgCatPRC2 TaxID=1130821 RepID=A0A151H1M2_TOXGO|nr:hypothetical protein TGPRC2_220260 [Toxoplasma gondii TgCatPRC2]
MAVPAAVLSQLRQQWNVNFKPEALELLPILLADACDDSASGGSRAASGSVSLQTLQRFLLTSDLRSLRLSPPLPEGFLAQKTSSALAAPLFLMLLSSRDITLPSKEGEEDFRSAAAAPCYRGHKRRMLLLKLTDGAGCTYTAIEHHFCRQLDVPLVPGLKMLVAAGTRVTNGLLLLEPATVQVLGGAVASLESAFKLREHVQQARLHRKAESEAPGREAGTGKEDEGPPRFLPFSYAAAKKALEAGKEVVAAALESQQKKSSREKAQSARRGEDREDARKAMQQLKDERHAGESGSKLERFQQQAEPKKAAVQALVVNQAARGRGDRRPAREEGEGASPRGRGGRGFGGRGRRKRDNDFENEGLYMKDSKAPVAYNLLDLICKEKPSAAMDSEQAPERDERPAVSMGVVSTPHRPPAASKLDSRETDRGRATGSVPQPNRGGRGRGRNRGGGFGGESSPQGGHVEGTRGGTFFSYYYAEDPASKQLSSHAPSHHRSSPGGGHSPYNASAPHPFSSPSPSPSYPAQSGSAHASLSHVQAGGAVGRDLAAAAFPSTVGPEQLRGARERGRGGPRGGGRGRGGGGRGKREFQSERGF